MISPAPNAPQGAVLTVTSYSATDFPLSSAVLCRNNAPLLAHAFALLRRSVPVRILGRDLGKGLEKVVDKSKATTPTELCSWATAHFGKEKRKAKSAKQRAAIEDREACLRVLAQSCSTMGEVRDKIKTLFVSDITTPCVALATGHKAKGLEWEHVFILDRHLIPGKWCEAPWEREQERNLLYVMVTRAKLTVTYVKSNCWTK